MSAILPRPSTVWISLGGGGLLMSLRLMADIEARTVADESWYVALAFAGVFGTALALGLGRELFAWLVTLISTSTNNYVARANADAQLARVTPAPALPAPQPRTVPYTHDGHTTPLTGIGTDTALARRQAWQRFMPVFVAWIEQAQGRVTSTALVGPGKAFSKVRHWQTAVDQLAAQGWATPRTSGDTTVLTIARGKLAALVRAGYVEWDEATDPPVIAPAPPRSGVVVSAEAAEKA